MSRSRKKYPIIKNGGYMKRRNRSSKIRRNWKMEMHKVLKSYPNGPIIWTFESDFMDDIEFLEFKHPYILINPWDVNDNISIAYINSEFKKGYNYIPEHWKKKSYKNRNDKKTIKKWYRK